jgi:hypothetical protein
VSFHFNNTGPRRNSRHESSPRFRERAASAHHYSQYVNNRKPPYTALRALFRSRGYVVAWHGSREKWNVARRGQWVPFHVIRLEDQTTVTRWVRWVAGETPEVSDGRDVPRDRVFAYAAGIHRGKKLGFWAQKTEGDRR